MGKPRGKNSSKARKLAKKKGLLKETDESKYSLDQLLDKAEELVDQYNYELSQKFCQRALEMNPDDVRALGLSATLLLEAGDVEGARHCLGRAITVRPDEGHSKYLTMAQLFGGREALGLYQKGIEIMKREQLSSADQAEPEASGKRKELCREISNAFCAISELFMTDLCDEGDAETECQNNFGMAIEADKENPEALQTKARYLLIKEKFEEAKLSLQQSLSLWLPKYQAVLDNKQEVGDFDPVEVCPLLYSTRIGTAKLLIELEMHDEATQVLEGLLEEDDEVVDTWYLLGWLNRCRATAPDGEVGYNGNARYYLSKAKRVNGKNPTEDKEMVRHIEEILSELGPEPEEEVVEDATRSDKNGDWEDIQSSEDEEEENAME